MTRATIAMVLVGVGGVGAVAIHDAQAGAASTGEDSPSHHLDRNSSGTSFGSSGTSPGFSDSGAVATSGGS